MNRVRLLVVVAAAIAVVLLLPTTGSGAPAVTWNMQSGNADGALHGIWMMDRLHGVAVGEGAANNSNKIVRTVDGGAHWIAPTLLPRTDTLNRVMFADATHGLAVGEPFDIEGGKAAVLRTSDGGDTWINTAAGTGANDLEAVFLFPDHLHAYASGANGTLISSADGGATWTDASAGIPAISNGNGGTTKSYDIDAMWWVSRTEGWLAGNRVDNATPGLILHTTDGGTNWAVVDSHSNTDAYESIMFTDASHGWAVGDCVLVSHPASPDPQDSCDRGVISKWDGTKWTDISPSLTNGYDMQGIWFVDANHGWAVADGRGARVGAPLRNRLIIYTDNGGATWTEQLDNGPQPVPATASPTVSPTTTPSPSPTPFNASSGLNFVMAVDICHAWASGGESLIINFTGGCPSPVASQAAAVGLPKAGAPGPVGAAWSLIAIVLISIIPAAGLLLRRRTSRG